MSKRVCTLLIVLIFFSVSLSGCYYFSARDQINLAEKLTSELKGAGGANLAPYEYTSAEKFLEVAKEEYNESDYKAAKELAVRSKSAAQAGLDEVKKKK